MTIYDILGIGFGPANLALAIALEERGYQGKVLFLEGRPKMAWQPEMMLPGSDIQNHPCRDLITPRNPRSRYTFINFLYEHERLFEHLNLGVLFPLRREYAEYIQWVASFFSHLVRFEHSVLSVECEQIASEHVYRVSTTRGTFYGRSLILGTGRTPNIPSPFEDKLGPRVTHLTHYLSTLAQLPRKDTGLRIAVVGSSQSAIEIVLHLIGQFPNADVYNIMRGHGYRLKDVSPFTGHAFFPEFVDYFYASPRSAKRKIFDELRYTNYSAADGDVINRLYLSIYEQKLVGRERVHLQRSQHVVACETQNELVTLVLQNDNTNERTRLDRLDLVVLATGFRDLGTDGSQERYPAILEGIAGSLAFDAQDCLEITRDYRVHSRDPESPLPPLYLNGLCESSHGYGDAGSFSLLALRAAEIADSLEKSVAMPLTPLDHAAAGESWWRGEHGALTFESK